MRAIEYRFDEYGERYVAWKRNDEGDRVFLKVTPVHTINGTGSRQEDVDSPFDATWFFSLQEACRYETQGYHASRINIAVTGEKP